MKGEEDPAGIREHGLRMNPKKGVESTKFLSASYAAFTPNPKKGVESKILLDGEVYEDKNPKKGVESRVPLGTREIPASESQEGS